MALFALIFFIFNNLVFTVLKRSRLDRFMWVHKFEYEISKYGFFPKNRIQFLISIPDHLYHLKATPPLSDLLELAARI